MRDDSSSSAVLDRPTPRAAVRGVDLTEAGGSAVPLSYTQLRLLAESAAGLGDVAAKFCMDDGRLTWIPATREVPAEAVLIPSFDPGKYPTLQEVLLSVEWTANPDAHLPVAGSGTVDAANVHADAVFWSDAAVQKFVLPYLASCAGHDAWHTVAGLQRAWNHAQTRVNVFALIHVVSRFDEEITLENSFRVAYVEFAAEPGDGYQVTTVPLGAFITAFGGVLPDTPKNAAALDAVEYSQPAFSGLSEFPGYAPLREMAEYGASLTSTQYLVWNRSLQYPEAMESAPPPAENQLVVPTCTRTIPDPRLVPGSVVVRPDASLPLQWTLTPADADALFWSTGAIQQFMLPYYASVSGFNAPAELAQIINAWSADQPGGEAPIRPDPRTNLPWEFGDVADAESTEEMVVYGLVHLPKSEWSEVVVEYVEAYRSVLTDAEHDRLLASLDVSDPFSVVHKLGVLHSQPGIGLRVLPLAFFNALYLLP